MIQQVASGAAVGAAVGALAGWAVAAMKARRASAEEVTAQAPNLGRPKSPITQTQTRRETERESERERDSPAMAGACFPFRFPTRRKVRRGTLCRATAAITSDTDRSEISLRLKKSCRSSIRCLYVYVSVASAHVKVYGQVR